MVIDDPGLGLTVFLTEVVDCYQFSFSHSENLTFQVYPMKVSLNYQISLFLESSIILSEVILKLNHPMNSQYRKI